MARLPAVLRWVVLLPFVQYPQRDDA